MPMTTVFQSLALAAPARTRREHVNAAPNTLPRVIATPPSAKAGVRAGLKSN
jgi:hypothetical protein